MLGDERDKFESQDSSGEEDSDEDNEGKDQSLFDSDNQVSISMLCHIIQDIFKRLNFMVNVWEM